MNDHAKVFVITIFGLLIGFVAARKFSDLLLKWGVPISTGDVGRVAIGTGAANGIRPAS